MVQNRKFGAGLALVTGLIGMGVSGAAWALPEVDVKTIPPIVAPNVVDAPDSIVDPDDAAA